MANIFGGSMAPQSSNIVEMLVQTVKQDVEQMEKGKQWPYSCYSLAKDCSSIPGLDDLSPEEIRFEAYQAKANGSVPAFQQKMQDLKNSYAAKRQQLVNPTNELKDVYRRIYNKENIAGTSSVFNGATFSSGSSPFGGMGTPSAKPVGSIFGGSASSSIFGNRAPATSTASIFGNSGSGLFGAGSQQQQPQQSGSIFGGGGSNLFGSPQTQSSFGSPAQSSSIFGSSAATSSGGIFGQKSVAVSPFGGQTGAQQTSLFGQSSGSSIFGLSASTQSPTSAFGQQQPATSSVFGAQNQASIFGQTAKIGGGPFQGSSLFGGQQPASGVFGGSGQQSPSTGPFSQPQQQQTNLFGGRQQSAVGIFGGQAQQQQQQPSSGIFGGGQGQQQPQTPTALFGGQAQQPSTGLFGTQSPQQSSIFGSQAPQQPASGIFGQQQQQQPQAAGIFGNQTSQHQSPSLFGQPQGSTTSSTPFGSGTSPSFGAGGPDSSKPQGNLFGNRGASVAPGQPGSTPFGSSTGGGLFGEVIEPQVDSSTYTPIDQIGKENLEIFQSGKFELGKIPEMPPPRELCV